MADQSALSGSGLWLSCRSLWKREMVRFLRQRSRIIGALGTPLVFWILVGAGLQRSFQLPGASGTMSYLEFSYPGAIAAILLFTAVFSTISLIEDRREGFLQAVLVAPVSRTAIVMGKLLGATTLAVGQGALFLMLAPAASIPLSWVSFLAMLGAMVVVSFAVTGLGFCVAWRMESTQGFHAIMNLVLMPMLVLSGAFFPHKGSATWLSWVVSVNPMTYGVSLLRHALYAGGTMAEAAHDVSTTTALAISLAFAAATVGLAVASVSRRSGEPG